MPSAAPNNCNTIIDRCGSIGVSPTEMTMWRRRENGSLLTWPPWRSCDRAYHPRLLWLGCRDQNNPNRSVYAAFCPAAVINCAAYADTISRQDGGAQAQSEH